MAFKWFDVQHGGVKRAQSNHNTTVYWSQIYEHSIWGEDQMEQPKVFRAEKMQTEWDQIKYN